ncbi:MAG TPA: roadblock/LC7 domain-containing protein [Mycobacteriales bacterium]|nr:roadblock/LC7 domain-containing protein [Mycobacteriales bacterium]
MSDTRSDETRASRLERALRDLIAATPDLEAAAVVSFDGLPMASALPAGMDEDRVAAMSAALLSLGERATEGLGRGALSQVFIEGENGTVFLVSAEDEAVLVAVAAKGAKTGLMLYEVKRSAAQVADVLRHEAPPAQTPAEIALGELEALPAYESAAANGAAYPPPPTYAPYATGTGSEAPGSAWS